MVDVLTTWDRRAQFAQRSDGQWFCREMPLRRGRREYGAWYAVDARDVPEGLHATAQRARLPVGGGVP